MIVAIVRFAAAAAATTNTTTIRNGDGSFIFIVVIIAAVKVHDIIVVVIVLGFLVLFLVRVDGIDNVVFIGGVGVGVVINVDSGIVPVTVYTFLISIITAICRSIFFFAFLYDIKLLRQ